MSIHCECCGKRVATLASLRGHYRRRHPSAPVQRGAGVAGTGWRSDGEYVRRVSSAPPSGERKGQQEPKPAAVSPATPKWDWFWWGALAVSLFLMVSFPESGAGSGGDASLLSTYQPEGDGGQ